MHIDCCVCLRVAAAGLEPAPHIRDSILSRACKPFHHAAIKLEDNNHKIDRTLHYSTPRHWKVGLRSQQIRTLPIHIHTSYSILSNPMIIIASQDYLWHFPITIFCIVSVRLISFQLGHKTWVYRSPNMLRLLIVVITSN